MKEHCMQLKDPILIAGAARSGTSLVTGIIHRHGAIAGAIGKNGDQWNDWLEDHERFMEYLKSEFSNVVEIWYEDLQAGNYTGISNVIKWLGFEFDKQIINNIIIKR